MRVRRTDRQTDRQTDRSQHTPKRLSPGFVYMTHSHETSADSFGDILRYTVLRTADSADIFGV